MPCFFQISLLFRKSVFSELPKILTRAPGSSGRHSSNTLSISILKNVVFVKYIHISFFCENTVKPEGRGCAGSLRMATWAPPGTQISLCLTQIVVCEENMQKLMKVVNMRNPREGELPGSPKGVLRKLQWGTQWSQMGAPGDSRGYMRGIQGGGHVKDLIFEFGTLLPIRFREGEYLWPDRGYPKKETDLLGRTTFYRLEG